MATPAARRSVVRTPYTVWAILGIVVVLLFVLAWNQHTTINIQPPAPTPTPRLDINVHRDPAPAPPRQARQVAPAQSSGVTPKGVCDDGFQEYSEGVRCRKMYAEAKPPVKAEPCKPGTKREVADPARPGFTLFQECGAMPKS